MKLNIQNVIFNEADSLEAEARWIGFYNGIEIAFADENDMRRFADAEMDRASAFNLWKGMYRMKKNQLDEVDVLLEELMKD